MVAKLQIKELAHAVWQENGRPEDKDLDHYSRAKHILEERQVSSAIELAPPQVPDVPPGQYKYRRHTRR
jgi:hypothetical protein